MNRDLELLIAFLQPIHALLVDDSVTEIMGNPDGSWWYERGGRVERADDIHFDAKSLHTGLEVIANRLGRKLDTSHPILNVQLPDGSRLAAVLPPVVRPAPSVTIRKFATARYTMTDLIERGALTGELAAYLRLQIESGRTLLISGGTGSGKTTLLNALADFIPEHERLVIIEDTSELRIAKPNILATECQTDTYASPVSFDTLLRSALRWRPDRIMLGEVRGEEARTLLDSFNTGHAGSMATIHASTAVKALRRFGELAMRAHQQATRDDIAAEIAESVQIVIQVQRFAEGRRVSEVIAVRGYDRTQKMFLYEPVYDLQPALSPEVIPHCHNTTTTRSRDTMPLLEITASKKVTAIVTLEDATARQIDQYAAFTKGSADDVVEAALSYVFDKDKSFQKFRDESTGAKPTLALRIKRRVLTATKAAKHPVEAKPSTAAIK